MVNPFRFIKETLPIADVMVLYGIEVKHSNKALCPLHNEKTPSFTLYPASNSWYCFGCGAGGSTIDFVMQVHGVDALEAAQKLDADFGLGLFNRKLSQAELHRMKNQQAEQHAQPQVNKGLVGAFEVYMNRAYMLLCDYLHLLNDQKIMYTPKSPEKMDKRLHPLFVEACYQLNYIEYLIDSLEIAGLDEQISFYQTHRGEMLKIAKNIRLQANSGKANKPA